jgi:predicted acylesterase/phospholipase RssA
MHVARKDHDMAAGTQPALGDFCRILSLDGGGAKGFYTLGVLREIEAMVGGLLCEHFDLIFGTSTGAIIAALLALRHNVDTIHSLYKTHVPAIMRRRTAAGRSDALRYLAKEVFGDRTFADFTTRVGIVTARWDFERPLIFKGDPSQAHGRQATFVPGFGCTIGDAIRGSCSAYPFFERTVITKSTGERVELIDGGYCANNPTLYAVADAVIALERSHAEIGIVSIGVGKYPEPKRWGLSWLVNRFFLSQLLQKTLTINTLSMEQLHTILFRDIWTIRINDEFSQPHMATDLLESNLKKLDLLYQRGGESFAKHEADLRKMMGPQQPQGRKGGA